MQSWLVKMVTASCHSTSLSSFPPPMELVVREVKQYTTCQFHVMTPDIFPFLATSPADYVALSSEEVRFGPCHSEVCATITTVNDELIEGDENFFLSMTRGPEWDSRISFSRSRSEVVILDDDCKWQVMLLMCVV